MMFAKSRFPTLFPVVSLVLSCALLSGCALLKKKKDLAADDESSVATAPTVAVSGSGAKNEKDVLRYASETKIADEPALIGKDGTKAKAFPASGADVATLAKGTPVVKIAKFFSTAVLVRFDDPTTADGTKLLGWIAPEAFALPGAVLPVVPVVAGGLGGSVAGKVGALADAGGLKNDAGGTGALDSGLAVAARPDSGTAVPPAVSPDAGVVVRATSLPVLQVQPTSGVCPSGFVLVPPVCRRPCKADGDCPKGTSCTSSAGKKTCSETK